MRINGRGQVDVDALQRLIALTKCEQLTTVKFAGFERVFSDEVRGIVPAC